MSTYYTRWCKEHGEWEMDIDNPSECPKCIELGMTEVQQLQKRVKFLEAAIASAQPGKEQNYYFQLQAAKKKLADWAEHIDIAPHKGCQCQFCVVTYRSKELLEELTNLKESFARLREDRDWHSRTRQEHFLSMLKIFQENLELKKQLDKLGVNK